MLTDASGAHRVYDASGRRFARYDGAERVTDEAGRAWRVGEDALVAIDGDRRDRLAAHRAFWFGWHAAHPGTALIGAPASAPASAE